MDTARIIVTTGGMLAIVWVIWYFFLSERQQTQATATESGMQEITIVVKGGYTPDTIVVKRGRPVRLKFFRDETNSCSDTVVFGDFGISTSLPAHETTPVEFTPEKPGSFVFTCGMNMLRGRLIVED